MESLETDMRGMLKKQFSVRRRPVSAQGHIVHFNPKAAGKTTKKRAEGPLLSLHTSRGSALLRKVVRGTRGT